MAALMKALTQRRVILVLVTVLGVFLGGDALDYLSTVINTVSGITTPA